MPIYYRYFTIKKEKITDLDERRVVEKSTLA